MIKVILCTSARIDRLLTLAADRNQRVSHRQNVVVVIVYSENEDEIRIISLRKALKHERTRFEAALRDELGED